MDNTNPTIDSKLDFILERYKDYVLGSQNVYFTGSKIALDKKETLQALTQLIAREVLEGRISELKELLHFRKDETVSLEVIQSKLLARLATLQSEKEQLKSIGGDDGTH